MYDDNELTIKYNNTILHCITCNYSFFFFESEIICDKLYGLSCLIKKHVRSNSHIRQTTWDEK